MKLFKILLSLVAFSLAGCFARAVVPSSTAFIQYTTTGIPQVLPVPYVFTNSSDLLVWDTRATAAPVALVINSDYSVSGGAGSTGSVTTISGGQVGVQVGDVITIVRNVPITQTTGFSNTGPLTASMVGQAFDKAAEISQQINVKTLNSLQFQPDEVISGVLSKASRSSNILGFNSAGAIQYYPPASTTVVNPGWVTPEMYGAVGNGTTDDTAAINSALLAAGSYGMVFFTAGKTYKVSSQLTVPYDGEILLGYGAKMLASAASKYRMILLNNRSQVTIEGLYFDGINPSGTGNSAGIVEMKTTCFDCTVRNCFFISPAQCGVFISTGERLKIEGCTFYGCFCAINTDDDTVVQPINLTITGNVIRNGSGLVSDNLSGGIKMSGLGSANSHAGHVISNNILIDVGQVGIELQTWVNDCAITGNTIKGAAYGISLSGVARCTATGNAIKDISTHIGIEDSGGLDDVISGNTIDIRDASGTLSAASCIGLNANSTGCTIVGNKMTGSSGSHLDVQIGTDVSATGNTIVMQSGATGATAVNLKDYTRVSLTSNYLKAAAGNWFFFCDSTDQSCSGLNISGNYIYGAVTTGGLRFYTPNSNTQTNAYVVGNYVNGSSGGFFTDWGDITKTSQIVIKDNWSAGGGGTANSLNVPYFATSSSLTTNPFFSFVAMSASGGARTVTLETAVGVSGLTRTISKTDSSGNAVTVATTSSQSISGNNAGGTYVSATTYSLAAQGARVTVESDGANWQIIQAR